MSTFKSIRMTPKVVFRNRDRHLGLYNCKLLGPLKPPTCTCRPYVVNFQAFSDSSVYCDRPCDVEEYNNNNTILVREIDYNHTTVMQN